MPDLAAAAGIERVHLVRARDVHDAVDHDRRRFDVPDVRNREHPAGRQPRDVALVDLRQRGVAVAAGIAVIRGPVALRGHGDGTGRRPSCGAGESLIVGAQLEIGHALVEHAAFERPSVGRLNRLADDDRRGGSRVRRLGQGGRGGENESRGENELHGSENIS